MRKISIIACLSAGLLSACGGGKTITGLGGTSSGGSSGGVVTVLSLGSGTAGSFQSGLIAIATKSLSAGGSTSLQVSIVDQTGALYTGATPVTFSSPCVSQGLATITVAGASQVGTATVTTSTGGVTATYAATGCSGSDVITATASANNQSLTASGTVTVAQAAIGSISFISATPANITLKGVGSTGGSATSIVVFKVLDTSNGPRAGATVDFSLNTIVGGVALSPASAVSGADGTVQTIVSSGTVATTVRVTAVTTTTGGGSISTQSNALTVSTGIPTSASISLAVLCHNVEAWNIDGINVPVTVSMNDRFSNPVPDGTTATFRTTLGGITGQCQTGSASGTAGTGSCIVNWVSKAPYSQPGNPRSTSGSPYAISSYCPSPAGFNPLCNGTTNGRSPILVTAIGEESFVDANGNGTFDPGDTTAFNSGNPANNFASGQPKPWDDTSEPFLNQWELGIPGNNGFFVPLYVVGEPYLDFNSDGARNGPDGLFNGPLCTGSLCNTTQTSVAIYSDNIIILSSGHPVVTPAWSGTYSYATNGPNIQFQVADENNNPMPNGTTVGLSVPSTIGTIQGPPLYTWGCETAIGGKAFSFNLQPPAVGGFGTGSVILTITSPAKIVTTYFVNVKP